VTNWANQMTTYAPSDGLKVGTSYAHIGPNDMVMGFNRGIVAYTFGPSNSASQDKSSIRDSYLRENNYNVVAAGTTNLEITGNELMMAQTADLLDIFSNALSWRNNYEEQDNRSEAATWILGQLGLPAPTSYTLQPNSTVIESNNVTCSAATGIPLLNLIQGVATEVRNNVITGCSSSTPFVNATGGAATIVRGNTSPDIPRAAPVWLTSTQGVSEYDTTCAAASSSPCAPLSGGSAAANNTILSGYCNGTVGAGSGVGYGLMPASGGSGCSSPYMVGTPVSYACTAKNLYVSAYNAGALPASGIVRFIRNGSASALTCTLGPGLACKDTSDVVSLAAGDTWGFNVTTAQLNDTTGEVRATVQCQ
jgi:hypothetical protein